MEISQTVIITDQSYYFQCRVKSLKKYTTMSYLEDNHILTDKQGGFRKNNSTINTVTNLTHEIYSAINNHEISLTTFIDFSKAFDTVNHEILLAKLKLLGIKNKDFSWLENYLTDRKQCTLVAGTTSEFMKIT